MKTNKDLKSKKIIDIPRVHNITNTIKPVGNQMQTWRVDGGCAQ